MARPNAARCGAGLPGRSPGNAATSARAWRRFAPCVVFAEFAKGKLVSLPGLCPGNASFPHTRSLPFVILPYGLRSKLTDYPSKGPPWRAPPWGVFDGPAVVRTRTGRPTAVGKKQSGGLFFRPRVESHQARAWSHFAPRALCFAPNLRPRPKQAETDRPCHQARAWSHFAPRALCFAPNLRPRPKQI